MPDKARLHRVEQFPDRQPVIRKARPANVNDIFRVIKEVHATYSPKPGVDLNRPRPETVWPRVFLAGDWTATGWPATMEGAVRSGYLAAESVAHIGGQQESAFLLEARLDDPDGSSTTIGTDASWKVLAHTAFIETNATYFPSRRVHAAPASQPYWWTIPEEAAHLPPAFAVTNTGESGGARAAIQFDSRLEPAGWQNAGFDDSRWASATVVDRPDYHLYAQTAPAEREQAELKPLAVKQAGEDWLVDFGRCLDGWPILTMRANRPGDRVRVSYFQLNNEKGPSGWDEYICRGGKETWKPNFGRHTSFQLLRITGYAGKLKPSDVRGIWAYCDAEVAGRQIVHKASLHRDCRMTGQIRRIHARAAVHLWTLKSPLFYLPSASQLGQAG